MRAGDGVSIRFDVRDGKRGFASRRTAPRSMAGCACSAPGGHMTDKPAAIHEVFAYLRVRDTAEAMRFYAAAFGAEEIFRLTEPTGRIGHAEMRLGPAVLMLSDPYP